MSALVELGPPQANDFLGDSNQESFTGALETIPTTPALWEARQRLLSLEEIRQNGRLGRLAGGTSVQIGQISLGGNCLTTSCQCSPCSATCACELPAGRCELQYQRFGGNCEGVPASDSLKVRLHAPHHYARTRRCRRGKRAGWGECVAAQCVSRARPMRLIGLNSLKGRAV